MMVAGQAAARGRRVLLLEKYKTLGKKLLITGGGRCNVTNNKKDVRELASKYKGSDQFLFSAFSQYAVVETLEFFAKRNMPVIEENEGRLFPATQKAQTVWNMLVDYMKETGVTVMTGVAVSGIKMDGEKVVIKTSKSAPAKTVATSADKKENQEFVADSCIVATGGKSRPETGSTGEGFEWLRGLGHKIIENDFALVPIALKDSWVKNVAGVTLPEVKINVYQDGQKQSLHAPNVGKLLFTHVGVSGPTILNMSREIGELLEYGDVLLKIDLFPKLGPGELKEKFQTLLLEESNKKLKNVLSGASGGGFIPPALVMPLLELIKSGSTLADTPCHSVSREARLEILNILKALPLNVKCLLGANKAIVSSGGVDLTEVNFKTMQSRIIPQIFLIGDVLNINRPSGGYSLQLCWTTGFIAGNNA